MLDAMTVQATTEALSRADAAWLHAEAPNNHFVVTSLALLDSPVDFAHFKTMLRHRVAMHPRLTQVVSDPGLPVIPPRWEPVRDFDLDAHLHRSALPGRGGSDELAAFIGDLVGRPLDLGRPLWESYVVQGGDGCDAVITRFHHALGDGQAMGRMLLTLTDRTAEGWRHTPHARRGAPASRDGRSAFARVIDSLPPAGALARSAAGAAGTFARLTLLDPDRPTPLRGTLGLVKAVAWSAPIPLQDVKRVARATETTVNDVLVSAIAGGLGEHLRSTGVDTRGLRIRAMVPVNLRPLDDTATTGNRFSLVFLELPVGVTGAWERLMRVKVEMDRIKASQEPGIGWMLVQGLGLLPAGLERMASGFYADKASLVLTNVIGPREPIYLAGARVRQLTFWEPESGGLGVGVSIYSYAGEVTVGVVSDRKLIARPQQITQAVTRAYAQVAAEA